jgi:hypothetical protein
LKLKAPKPLLLTRARWPESWPNTKCSYSLRKAIKQAKCQYRDKVESEFNGLDTRGMWQGLQSIMDYKKKTSPVADEDVLLPDILNNLFAQFEDNTVPLTQPATKTSKTFKSVNPCRAAGPSQGHQTVKQPPLTLKGCCHTWSKLSLATLNNATKYNVYIPYITHLICIYCTRYHLLHLAYAVLYHHSFIYLYVHILHPFTLVCIR